jgi:predicted O-methyltransferase YrrM
MAVNQSNSRLPLSDYLAERGRIDGWFHPPDTGLFLAFNELQEKHGVGGDILEVGTYLGRSAILLGYLPRPGERLVVCDVWEDSADLSPENRTEDELYHAGLSRGEFERNYLRFHSALPDICQMPSGELDQHLPAGSFRFIHVDGSDAYDVVRNDIAIARKLLTKGGVLALDDWSMPEAPGVGLAIWEEYLKGDLIPLCFSTYKLYATWDPDTITAEEIRAWAATRDDVVVTHRHELAGRGAHHVADLAEWQQYH